MPTTHTFGTSQYLDVGAGRKLHYMVKGEGTTTVVFESGMGASRAAWGLVQPAIAQVVRTVVYDRAGLGRSDADNEPRTLERITGDLLALLGELGPGPFILVGHSWGGPIVRRAAEKLLASSSVTIQGLVLVDPSDEHVDLYFSKAAALNFALLGKLLPGIARLGLYRRMSGAPPKNLPQDIREEHLREDFTLQAAKASVAEMTTFLKDLKELRHHPAELGHLEVVILSGTVITRMERRTRPALIAAHRKSVSLLTNARHVEAPRSGHMIVNTEPELIIEAVLHMIRDE